MSTRVFLPENIADWMSKRLSLGDLRRIQFRLCRRIPFWWLVPGRTFAGLTLWNRIYLVESYWPAEPTDRFPAELILHELVHVAQYRRSPLMFPLRYLVNHMRYGYEKNPAEIEARETAAKLAQSFSSWRLVSQ